ncbi:MAG: VOC family protein [Gemmatimonadales bacterium]|nr:MAG: VOC family protein [Gemmatimonadales bacterium]
MTEPSRPSPVPEGYHTITPYLYVKGAAEAIEFYRRAFGAEELFRLEGPGDLIGHAEMRIGDSPFMLSDEFEAWENRSPLSLGGSAGLMMVYVADVDAAFARALEAGATQVRPPENHFYGDRAGTLEDPFGHRWTLSTHVEDVPPDVMSARMKEMFGG